MQNLVKLNLDYYFAEINSSTVIFCFNKILFYQNFSINNFFSLKQKAKMIEEFNKELKLIQGKEIKVVKLGAVDGLLETVAASITTSIMLSKSRS